ncbi:hypothetical protein Bca52824_053838 [Brassica carinata]|uniref:Uncharacterized protein n=1 Tax=Brassica carinata TaxID=52824 RepID=A0A8X7R9P0_BRACI|nr:hypothetical protein Bca52824_053838 [Brassica carinata]
MALVRKKLKLSDKENTLSTSLYFKAKALSFAVKITIADFTLAKLKSVARRLVLVPELHQPSSFPRRKQLQHLLKKRQKRKSCTGSSLCVRCDLRTAQASMFSVDELESLGVLRWRLIPTSSRKFQYFYHWRVQGYLVVDDWVSLVLAHAFLKSGGGVVVYGSVQFCGFRASSFISLRSRQLVQVLLLFLSRSHSLERLMACHQVKSSVAWLSFLLCVEAVCSPVLGGRAMTIPQSLRFVSVLLVSAILLMLLLPFRPASGVL